MRKTRLRAPSLRTAPRIGAPGPCWRNRHPARPR